MGKKSEKPDNRIKLTGKQKLFADAYVETLNGTEAARRAKYKGDDVTLASVGYENLRKPQIRAYIDNKFADQQLTANEVVSRLSSIASGSMADFLTDDHQLDLARAGERGKLHLIKKLRETRGPNDDDGVPTWTKLEVELYAADAALERVARILGIDKQRIEHSGSIDVSKLSDKELEAIASGKHTDTS